MAQVEFAGQSRKNAESPTAATSQLVNCYREPYDEGFVIRSVLGTSIFSETGQIFLRAMKEIDGDVYAVAGGKLFKITSTGAAANLGDVDQGDTTIVGNNGNVCVAAGGNYYVWDGATLSEPTGGAFDAVGSVDFVAQITVMTEAGGRRFQWTNVADPETINGLNFATAEGNDDDIIRGVVLNGNYWLFKEKSTEIWYPSGSGFSRIQGGVLERGLKAYNLICRMSDGVFFIGDDGICYISTGGGLQPVSFPAVEVDIRAGEPSKCFYYEDDGHKICVIAFSDRPAWCLDLSTGEWHNRASGVNWSPWPMVASVKAFGHWHCGDESGNILRLSRINEDHNAPMKRRMVSRTLREAVAIREIELFPKAGHEVTSGRAAELVVRVSHDYGKTWGSPKARSCGDLGNYKKRVRVLGLGWGRQTTVEVTMTDPVDVPILAIANVEGR